MNTFKQFTLSALAGLLVAAVIIYLQAEPKADSKATPEAVLFANPAAPTTPTQQPSAAPQSYADAIAQAQPAVVNIYTTKIVTRQYHPLYDDPVFQRFFGLHNVPRRQRMQASLGSGVIVSPYGYILTSNHVIAGADEIKISLGDGREALAAVVGTDPETDLAVLFIEVSDLPAITFADLSNTRVGDIVLAIGNPYNIGQTATQGIISAMGRNQINLSSFVDFIQTDAAINPGNSGGALVNTQGQLVGINTAIYSRSGGSHGIGFAIPVDLAKQVMLQIVEHGSVIRGWLGIEPQLLNPGLANAIGIDQVKGILVAGVFKDGPAYIAGVQPGDVITGIDNMSMENPKEALNYVSHKRPGEKVEISISRKGESYRISATIGERPKPQ